MREVKIADRIRWITMLVFATMWLAGNFIISDGIINYRGELRD